MAVDDDTSDAEAPLSGERVQHGTGVTSNRAFPTNAYPQHLDPFVLFERFYIEPDKGFPMHPHEGFEIVSYLLEGGMDHEDSLGVANTATEGDVMRVTTGSGIRHSEFPADGAACNGLQLWVNLPRARKDIDPGYADADAEELPTESRPGATITTVVGEGSPIELQTPMEYLDVRVTDRWTWSVADGWSGFLYGVDGTGRVDGWSFGEGDVVPLVDARDVEVATDSGLRVVAVAGHPHDEPIRQRGPFVF
ncbi:pirin family protein [Halobellus inordinatus]|uniref:pirin family protein n=1 Tax=Halobellus inordinatus TaxID=1126236 RepID=UPI00210A0C4C|nr:pirin family protein [Halobellus inordinatus]